MLIANPIYDVVFKRLMENDKVAKFFISTLIEEEIDSIEVQPQEFTFINELDLDDPKVEKYIKEKVQERLSINIFRLDFIATIKTETGDYKKVLIEIQKAKNQIDLMRFRKYLAEQYRKEDKITIAGNDEKVVLPITTIYILGFKLPEIDSPCIKVERNYKDLVNKKTITQKSDFVEKLTHDSFVVQIERITDRFQTRLDKLLSVFEQSHFIDENKIVKQFSHTTDIDEIKLITEILHHSGTTPEERKKIEVEQEAWRTLDAIFDDLNKLVKVKNVIIEEKEKEIEQKDKILEEKVKTIEEKDKSIEEKDKSIEEKVKTIEEKDKSIEEKDKSIEEKVKTIEEKEKTIEEKDKLIEELMRKLGQK
jgi:hypothetical protein